MKIHHIHILRTKNELSQVNSEAEVIFFKKKKNALKFKTDVYNKLLEEGFEITLLAPNKISLENENKNEIVTITHIIINTKELEG